MESKMDEFVKIVSAAAKEFADSKFSAVRVISHLDSDGIVAASIIVKLLEKLSINYVVSIVPVLDRGQIEILARERYGVYIFTDLGSGSIINIEKLLASKKIYILDHHKPEKDSGENVVHVNPCLVGIDGGKAISGAGVAYYFAREIEEATKEMAGIALVGAIGDMQNDEGFHMLNSLIYDDAVAEGIIEASEDSKEHSFCRETMGELNTLRKFSTVLNACGRLGKGSIGIGACLGDNVMKEKAVSCLAEYRQEISKAMRWIEGNKNTRNVIIEDGYMIINAKDRVLGTIIGTMSSMISKSDNGSGMYILAMARIDGHTKVSLRFGGKKEGIDLRELMKEIIANLGGGEFGGHKYASGAIISTDSEEKFIEISKMVLSKKSMEEGVY